MYGVYIIHSEKLSRYYIGSSANVTSRLLDHNAGKSVYTSKGRPWVLVWSTLCETRSDAIRLEKHIKGRGAARFLRENG